jgi:phosphopantothenoylcysteine decarboxylase/phosphopantothenate--cysteine ligase
MPTKPSKKKQNHLSKLPAISQVKKVQDTGVKKKSTLLRRKKIAVVISGGIGSVEMVKNIREIRRHEAEITAFMTEEALKFITKLSIEWASDSPVITELGARTEHLNSFDLVLVSPCTLNTLAKVSLGISDSAATLLIASQLGRKKPIIFIPTMNEDMKNHPLYEEYKAKLLSWGAQFLEAPLEESRLKMPVPEAVANIVIEGLK